MNLSGRTRDMIPIGGTMRKVRQFICSLCVLLLFFNGCKKEETAIIYESEEQQEIDDGNDFQEEDVFIYVYVCGQVHTSGVFQLPKGARIADALAAAGGMTEGAAETYLNQAELLKDGQKIYVPAEEEAAEEISTSGENGKVNLNTASVEELMTLNGIGESKARAIVQYREEQGRFENIEDIMKIEGIKEGVFRKIADKISVE